MFWVLFIGFSLLSYIVSATFKSRIKKYLQTPSVGGLSGKDVAEMFLRDYNINDVKIVPTKGFLTDHYNPATKTVGLSPEIYYGRSLAAMAVAAHETGHALQHHNKYFWVQIRSGLVPIVQLGSHLSSWLLLGGMFTLHVMPQIMLLGIIAYAVVVLFSLITLPVEFDASNRALKWLKAKGLSDDMYKKAKDALKWAAMTYVVAALTALASLIYYVLIFMSATSDE